MRHALAMQCPDFRTRCVLLGSDFPQQSRCFVALPIGLDRGRSIHQPHAGEYKVSGAEVFGLAFHIGARVAAKRVQDGSAGSAAFVRLARSLDDRRRRVGAYAAQVTTSVAGSPGQSDITTSPSSHDLRATPGSSGERAQSSHRA